MQGVHDCDTAVPAAASHDIGSDCGQPRSHGWHSQRPAGTLPRAQLHPLGCPGLLGSAQRSIWPAAGPGPACNIVGALHNAPGELRWPTPMPCTATLPVLLATYCLNGLYPLSCDSSCKISSSVCSGPFITEAWHFLDHLISVQVTLGMHFWSGLAMVFTLLVQVLVSPEHECFLHILPFTMQSLRQSVADEAHSGRAGCTAPCLFDLNGIENCADLKWCLIAG